MRQSHEGQGTTLQNEGISIEQQETQTVSREKLLHVFRQLQKAINCLRVPFLQRTKLFRRKRMPRFRPRLWHADPLALLPRFSNPRMYIDIDLPFISKLAVISFKLCPAALLPYHSFLPYSPNARYE